MASEQDVMKLVAQIVDDATGPLAKIRKSYQQTHHEATKGSKEAARAAREHAKRLKELREQFQKVRDVTVDLVAPALAAIGISGLGAAEAIKSVVEASRRLGETGRMLEMVGNRSGMSARKIQMLDEAAAQAGISVDQMNQGISQMGEFLDQTREGLPEALRKWDQFPLAFQKIGKSIIGLDRDQSVNRVLGFLGTMGDKAQKRQLLGLLGLPQDWASFSRDTIRDIISTTRREFRLHPALDPHQAEEADKAWRHFDATLRGLSRDFENIVSPEVTAELNKVQRFFDDKDNIKAFQQAFHAVATEINEDLGTLAATVREIEEVLKFFKRHKVLSPSSWGSVALQMDQNPWNEILPGGAKPSGTKPSVFDAFRAWVMKHKMTDAEKFAGGYAPMAFHPGSTSGARNAISESVKTGVLDGFREWAGLSQTPGGGFTNAAYHPGGGGPRSYRFGSADYPVKSITMGGQVPKSMQGVRDALAPRDDNTGAALSGSAYLKARRQKFADELKNNPGLRNQVAGMALLEGSRDPVPVIESLLNRSDYDHKSLRQMLHSGFYGPINRGQLPGAIARLKRDPKLKARMDRAIDAALNGSDIIHGATDQGMPTDPNGRWPGGRIFRHGNVFNDWGGGPGGHEGARRWREALERGVLREAVAPQPGREASLRDYIRDHHVSAVRSFLKQMVGPAGGKLGDASLSIDLNGFPRGIRMRSSATGIFKQVTLNRGRPMVMASQDG